MSPADRVRQIIADQLGVAEQHVTDNAHLADALGADSLDVVEIELALEEDFGIEIPSYIEPDGGWTVGGLVREVEKRLPKERVQA